MNSEEKHSISGYISSELRKNYSSGGSPECGSDRGGGAEGAAGAGARAGGAGEAAASVRGCQAGLTRRSRSALQPAIYRGAP